jgi:hypothetical protein
MKISWGTGIAIFYTLFVVFMIAMVVYSKSFDNTLVVDNYYEEDLKYQSHIDKLANSKALANDLVIRQQSEAKVVQFLFPPEFAKVEGKILFYRADDGTRDFLVKIQPSPQGLVEVPTRNLAAGRWTIKVNWSGDGKAFYKEETLVL